MKLKSGNPKPKVGGRGTKMICSLLCIGILAIPIASIGREVHPFRNSSRCDMRPSDASNRTGITLGLQPAAGGTAEERTTISNGVNAEGWRIPNLRGLICYSADVEKMDGVKRIVEKFCMPVEDMSQR